MLSSSAALVTTRSLVVVVVVALTLTAAPVLSSSFEGTGQQSGLCSFPSFLGRWTRWESAISAERRIIGVVWMFDTSNDGGMATSVNYTDASTVVSRYYRCVQTADGGTGNRLYVEVHTGVTPIVSSAAVSTSSLIGYQCIEFIERSPYVVQVVVL